MSFVLFSFFSCSTTTEPIADDYNWEKIELPDQVSVYSFYGSFSNYILIGTLTNIMRSDDAGKSWEIVYQPSHTINNFITKNDTLFAVSNFDDYFSLDDGESWSQLGYNLSPEPQNNKVINSRGIVYKMEPLFDGELAQPTLILESTDNENNWKEIFPFKHYVYSIHIDNGDRLYLGINGVEWNEERKGFIESPDNKAIIYYLNNN